MSRVERGNEWMAKYKNSVADIELPNVKTWHSVSTLKVRYFVPIFINERLLHISQPARMRL